MAYLPDIDPNAEVKKLVPLTLTVSIVEEVTSDIIAEVVVVKAPPVSLEPIAPLYRATFNETRFFSFSFADQEALNAGDDDQSQFGGLKVRITGSTIAGVVELG